MVLQNLFLQTEITWIFGALLILTVSVIFVLFMRKDAASGIGSLSHLAKSSELESLSERQKDLKKTFEEFEESITMRIDKNTLDNSEKIETIRKDVLSDGLTRMMSQLDEHMRDETITKKEYDDLKDQLKHLLIPTHMDSEIHMLGKIFSSLQFRTISWQCNFIKILFRGYCPDTQKEMLTGDQIPTSHGSFLKSLEGIGVIKRENTWYYKISPEFEWITKFIESPTQLQILLDSEIKKEKEYQDYIENNLNMVEYGLLCPERQYQVPGGKIDVICVDSKGRKVGLELKYPKARIRDKRQIMDYKRDYIAKSGRENSRFILVAPEIPNELKEMLQSDGIEYKEVQICNVSDLGSADLQETESDESMV